MKRTIRFLTGIAIRGLIGIVCGILIVVGLIHVVSHLDHRNVTCQSVTVTQKNGHTFVITADASGAVTNYTFVVTGAVKAHEISRTQVHGRASKAVMELVVENYDGEAYTVQVYVDGGGAENVTSNNCQANFQGSPDISI